MKLAKSAVKLKQLRVYHIFDCVIMKYFAYIAITGAYSVPSLTPEQRLLGNVLSKSAKTRPRKTQLFIAWGLEFF